MPSIGRFNRMDPMGMVDGPNMYNFCGGDPVNHVDPMGTKIAINGKLIEQWQIKAVERNLTPNQFKEFDLMRGNLNGTTNFDSVLDVIKYFQEKYEPGAVDPGQVARNLPGAYIETGMSGEQASGMAGSMDAMSDAVLLGHGTDFGQQYGHKDAYDLGTKAGKLGGFAINAVLTVSGVTGTVKGIQAVQYAGTTLQVAEVVTTTGQIVKWVWVNGKAIPLTAEALAGAGLSAFADANIIRMMMGDESGSAPTSSGTSSSGTSTSGNSGSATSGQGTKGLPNPRYSIRGTLRNDPLAGATQPEILQAFKDTGFILTDHFIKRIGDSRLAGIGIRTFKDIQTVLRYGTRVLQDDGTVAIVRGRVAVVIDEVNNTLVTIMPWK